MRNLVLGIALVVCLDVAFIWITSDADEAPEIAHAVVPHAAAPIIHESPSLDPVAIEDSNEPDDDQRTAWPRSTERRERETKQAARIVTSDVIIRDIPDPSLNAKRLFPDKIIMIGRTESEPDLASKIEVDRVGPSTSEDPAKVPEPKKRSFESRAFGVIKKPYTWIRSFSSKLF